MRLFLVFVLLMSMFNSQAQLNTDLKYRVHLKSGSIITGKIVQSQNSEKISVKSGENTWVFNQDEVEFLVLIPEEEQEELISEETYQGKKATDLSQVSMKTKGIYYGGSFSLMFGNANTFFDVNSSFKANIGVIINTKLALGVGSGFDFIQGAYSPFYLEGKYLLSPKKKAFYPLAFGGVKKRLESWESQHKTYFFGGGIGYQEYDLKGNILAVEAFYHYMHDDVQQTVWGEWDWNGNQITEDTTINIVRQFSRFGIRLVYNFL